MTRQWPYLLLLLLLAGRAASQEAATVMLEHIYLFQTHDLPFWRPSVYFLCAGEEKRFLTGVVEAHVLYNFTLNESFQPLTELEPPRCKSCGLYEADTLKEDDVFNEWELCPLDFKPAPDGRLRFEKEGEFNATFVCLNCNRDSSSHSTGMEVEGDAIDEVNPVHVVLIVLAIAASITLCLAIGVIWVQHGAFRRQVDPELAKFMEMFDEEEELLESRLEMGQPSGMAVNSISRGKEYMHDD